MVEALKLSGDPSRIHTEGFEARHAIEKAREEIASFLGAKPREVVFTSGATESIASTIYGVMEPQREKHILTSPIEHSAVLESADEYKAVQVPVSSMGEIDPEDIQDRINKDTALISLQLVNHEVGVTQDISRFIDIAKQREVPIHIDAAQAIGHMEFKFSEFSADLVSISSHKFGGPPGIGVLLIRQGLRINPFIKGGSQERARRGGLENKAAILGLAASIQALEQGRLQKEIEQQMTLTQKLIESCSDIEGLVCYSHPSQRAPHIVCFGFSDIEPQAVLLELDRRGISVHSGSACASEELEPSSVLKAMGVDAERSLRVSVGWTSTPEDIDAFGSELKESLSYLRKLNS